MTLYDLETPALLLDADKMERNIARMCEHLARFSVVFRPHAKTCKAIEPLRLCMASPEGPVTVSTLREADFFAACGIKDIMYAVGIAPNKFAHVLHLMRSGVNIKILLDAEDTARQLVAFAKAHETVFNVLIEIDVDEHRSGLAPTDHRLVAVASILRDGGQNMRGVLTHAGASYSCTSIEGIMQVAEQERLGIVIAATTLREAGFSCETVSLGSTPTATFIQNLDGVTEVRAGVFLFQDLVMATLGVCKPEDIAISVLASVIGHQADKSRIIIDAGFAALSGDRGIASQFSNQGYGLVCDVHGRILKDIIAMKTNQEHGVLALRPQSHLHALPPMPVGTLVRVLPNHACATVAPYDCYHVLRNGELIDTWKHFNGWSTYGTDYKP